MSLTKIAKKAQNKTTKPKAQKGMLVAESMNDITHTPLLPLSMFGKLPYCETINYVTAGAVGAASAYVFSANGLYDPNITGTGHQPMGFDQLMLFYEHYTVTKVKATVNFQNTDVDDNVFVGLLLAPDATIETNASKLVENGLLVQKHLLPYSNYGSACSLSISADISKINGKKDVKTEDDFRGDVSANPVEQTYLHVFAYAPFTVNTVAVAFEVILEYEAIFTEPRKMIQS